MFYLKVKNELSTLLNEKCFLKLVINHEVVDYALKMPVQSKVMDLLHFPELFVTISCRGHP